MFLFLRSSLVCLDVILSWIQIFLVIGKQQREGVCVCVFVIVCFCVRLSVCVCVFIGVSACMAVSVCVW